MSLSPSSSDSSSSSSSGSASRRTVVVSAGAAGLAAALAACGGSDKKYQETSSAPPSSPSASASAPADAKGPVLARTSDIPEGGGKVFKDKRVVVTQPAKGEFKAFSAVCTHEGCTVSAVTGGTINCPCHGSKFAVADGSVKHGPAQSPLPAKKITVSGDSITLD
ncbi:MULTISPECIES: Rieske (2Fe-2S) protein [Streptomyces]|uniref:Rieske (2Fe-2S) protein n=1 Tax=Streptomyces TaxID=1883 RepID=UPI00167D5292|nr:MULTISPECIES: Rieske (2Fe-2S) protein [Streptomyces]MCC2280699.1 Rieske (2Fe-2S) protein [Streptomyces sp. ET3-23]